MKTLVIAALTIICCLCHRSAGLYGDSLSMAGGCCPYNTNVHIPMRRITNMGMSPNHCLLKSIIVTTVRRKFCVDPELDWVKKALLRFQTS